MRKAIPPQMADAVPATARQAERAVLKSRNAQMLIMREQGATYTSIAAHFGVSHSLPHNKVKVLRQELAMAAKFPFWALLSVRSRNVLRAEVSEEVFTNPNIIVQCGSAHLLRLRNMGPSSLREIELALLRLGYLAEGQEW